MLVLVQHANASYPLVLTREFTGTTVIGTNALTMKTRDLGEVLPYVRHGVDQITFRVVDAYMYIYIYTYMYQSIRL